MNDQDRDIWENDPELQAMIARIKTLNADELDEVFRRIGVNLDHVDDQTSFFLSALESDLPSETIRETLRASYDLNEAIRQGTAKPN